MSRRFAKQFLYGLFYLAVWFGLIAVIHAAFFKAPASCENKRQDVGEEGIDCGGVCGNNVCLPSDLRAIEAIGPVQVFRPTLQTLELAAKIQNANFAFAARSFTYHFNVYGASDEILDSISGDSFIYGGEVKYLVGIRTGVTYIPARIELVIDEPTWLKAADYARPSIGGVQDKSIQVTSSTIEVSGKIVNNDVAVIRRVVITALFHDDLGIPTGISQTELDDVGPEETKPFSIFHPPILDVVPESTDIFISAERQ